MRAIFADTFYWVALTNRLDALHERALALPRSLGSPQIITTEQVITEYLNFFPEMGRAFPAQGVRQCSQRAFCAVRNDSSAHA